VPQVRVVTHDGENLGVMSIQDALAEAERRELDLIEVAPDGSPPVCRITDYGKFRYEQSKKLKETQKKSKQTEIKGIRVRPNTDDHDIAFKCRHAIKFLTHGDKVRFTVIFRGPELRHKEIGQQQLERFVAALTDYATVDQPPKMEGRRMTMVLDPRKDIKRVAPEQGAVSNRGQNEDQEGRGQAHEGDGHRPSPDPEHQAQPPALQEEPAAEAPPEAGQ
jgi:translation initiation factor IF-3